MNNLLARRAKLVADEALLRSTRGSGGGGTTYVAFKSVQQVSSSFTAEPNVLYMIDCSGGPVEMTLPVLAAYDLVGFIDWKAASNVHNITVLPNGSDRLMDPATNMYLAPGQEFIANYIGANATWIFDGVQLLPVFSG